MLGKIVVKNHSSTKRPMSENGYARHVLEGSSGNNALLVLEGKVNAVRTQGRLKRTWIDDIKE